MHSPGPLILAWYHQNGRKLPWRGLRNPYAIWLSEVILQQTRIQQGTAYYLRFIAAYPTVQHLAAATEAQVLKLWEGLGYYSRARNLHAAAKLIANELGGHFPTSAAALQRLKGIGPYTARAIASLAYDEAVAVVDGNVLRVISRYLADTTPIDTAKAHYQTLADAWLGSLPSADYNQAMMDLGALVCTPRNPQCSICPIQTGCGAYATGQVATLPLKAKKLNRPTRWFHCYIYYDTQGRLAVRQRQERSYWKGLWELPTDEVADAAVLPKAGKQLFTVPHEFTHFRMMLCAVLVATHELAPQPDWHFVDEAARTQLAFGKGSLKLLAQWAQHQPILLH